MRYFYTVQIVDLLDLIRGAQQPRQTAGQIRNAFSQDTRAGSGVNAEQHPEGQPWPENSSSTRKSRPATPNGFARCMPVEAQVATMLFHSCSHIPSSGRRTRSSSAACAERRTTNLNLVALLFWCAVSYASVAPPAPVVGIRAPSLKYPGGLGNVVHELSFQAMPALDLPVAERTSTSVPKRKIERGGILAPPMSYVLDRGYVTAVYYGTAHFRQNGAPENPNAALFLLPYALAQGCCGVDALLRKAESFEVLPLSFASYF